MVHKQTSYKHLMLLASYDIKIHNMYGKGNRSFRFKQSQT